LTLDKQNNNQLVRIVGYLFPLFLTILFLFLAFKNVDLRESFKLISNASFIPIILYVVIFYLSHLARALRWKYMMSSIKKDISGVHLFGSVIVSYGVSCVVPRLGELYRGLFLGKWEGVSRSTVIGTIVVERIIDIASFALAALVSISIFSGNLYDKIEWLKPSLEIGFSIIFVLTALLISLVKFQNNFKNGLIRFSNKINLKISERLSSIFDTLINGFSSVKSSKHILLIVIWTIIILLLYALNAFVGFYMLKMDDIIPVSFSMAWILMTISSFGAMIPTPGGTGPYHAISILILTQLYLFSSEISAAYAILTHFINYSLFVITTLIIIYLVNRQRVKTGLPKETFLSVFNIHSESK